MIWMYGQAEAFLETPTRENQLKALMALESAVRDLEARKLSDAQMTGADYDALMSQEMDVSFVQTNHLRIRNRPLNHAQCLHKHVLCAAQRVLFGL